MVLVSAFYLECSLNITHPADHSLQTDEAVHPPLAGCHSDILYFLILARLLRQRDDSLRQWQCHTAHETHPNLISPGHKHSDSLLRAERLTPCIAKTFLTPEDIPTVFSAQRVHFTSGLTRASDSTTFLQELRWVDELAEAITFFLTGIWGQQTLQTLRALGATHIVV